jgi:hypothetical protein
LRCTLVNEFSRKFSTTELTFFYFKEIVKQQRLDLITYLGLILNSYSGTDVPRKFHAKFRAEQNLLTFFLLKN